MSVFHNNNSFSKKLFNFQLITLNKYSANWTVLFKGKKEIYKNELN